MPDLRTTQTDPEIEEILGQMTLVEKVALLSGRDMWSVPGNDRLGIGALVVTDGPNGARGDGGLTDGVKAAAFPVGICLGATWDPDLVGQVGAAIAQEAQSKDAHVLLGPTCNIQRTVTNGRNFECYSEDPVLTARLAVAFISGVQSQGVGTTIKHFVGNESEIQRTTINSVISEPALREVYLLPFEAAVKEAQAWGVMSGYNKLNGTYCAEHRWLLTEVLRQDWGFDGMVVSDWFGSRTCAPTIHAGLTLEMPGPPRDRGEKLVAAVEAGEVAEEEVEELARQMLRLSKRTGALRDLSPRQERAEDRPEHRALIRRAATEGAVLLKNDGLLPLGAQSCGTIAVIGPNAATARIMGGGSSQINAHYAISPLDGLRAALGADRVRHAVGCTNDRFVPVLSGDFELEIHDGAGFDGPVVHRAPLRLLDAFLMPEMTGDRALGAFSARLRGTVPVTEDGVHRFGIVTTSPARLFVDGQLVCDAGPGKWQRGTTFFEEGCEEVRGEFELTAGQSVDIVLEYVSTPNFELYFDALRIGMERPLGDDAMDAAVALAAEADKVVLCIGRTGEWDTEGHDLTDIRLPGRQDELARRVLAANPATVVVLQTGGPVEMPWLEAAPAVLQAWYGGQEAGNAIADILLGKSEPGGRLAQSFPRRHADAPAMTDDPVVYPGRDGRVEYREGSFIGYRHYDAKGIAPLFPFGHGLGYTQFALEEMHIAQNDLDAGGRLHLRVRARNTGARAGKVVVQVYVGGQAGYPVRELKAFASDRVAPGATRDFDLWLGPRDFAHFDAEARGWKVAVGAYRIWAGVSAAELPLAADITLRQDQHLPV